MKTVFKWIKFELVENTNSYLPRKTKIYKILTRSSNNILGIIKWYTGWRKYCFYPEATTVFSVDCIKDIIAFIENLMERRKNESYNVGTPLGDCLESGEFCGGKNSKQVEED